MTCDVGPLVFWFTKLSLVFSIAFITKMSVKNALGYVTFWLITRSFIVILAVCCSFVLTLITFNDRNQGRLRGRVPLGMASPEAV